MFTPTFQRQADKAGLSDEDIQAIAAVLASNPAAGDLIPGTSGLRKLRFPRAGEGKSSGFRTIHYFAGTDVPIFLLALIDKRSKGNLSKAEQNQLAKLLPSLAAQFRHRQS